MQGQAAHSERPEQLPIPFVIPTTYLLGTTAMTPRLKGDPSGPRDEVAWIMRLVAVRARIVKRHFIKRR